jgi:hypothetical protein
MAATSRNTETSQYFPHTIYHKNAAQQARRNPGDPRSRILQAKSSNIYANAAQQARRNPGDPRSRPEDPQMLCSRPAEIQETHAAGPRISHIPTYMHKQLQQHFQCTPTCISSNIYWLRDGSTGHISQPLVSSFDKTATAPQTEQY